MSEMTMYLTSGVAMLISAAAVGTLGFVANTILPGPASFVRGMLLTFVLILAAGLSGFVATASIHDHSSIWAMQAVTVVVKTVIGTACGYAMVRSVTAARPVA